MTYGIYTDYNGKDKEKTVMETVSCTERRQRAGDGGSPVQVGAAENHSGVSFLKVSLVGNDVFPRYREHVSAQCPYSVTGGITKEQLFVLLHRIESFFYLPGELYILYGLSR